MISLVAGAADFFVGLGVAVFVALMALVGSIIKKHDSKIESHAEMLASLKIELAVIREQGCMVQKTLNVLLERSDTICRAKER